MRFKDIRRYLKPYSITTSRTTTINHAFAAAIAPSDIFDEKLVRAAIIDLGQNPDINLACVYCGKDAETWDHVRATVKGKRFSGYGHRLGNLLPCCKTCNSKKGNKDWRSFLAVLGLSEADRMERERQIAGYLLKYGVEDSIPEHLAEYQELQEIHHQVLELLKKADQIASIIRQKSDAVL